MRKQKIKEILWGIGLVAAAVFLILNQLQLLSFHLGLATIFWTVIFAVSLINSLVNHNLFGTVFSVAFLLIVYAEPLHITNIVPWTLLLATCLVYAGLHLIFAKSWHHYHTSCFFNKRQSRGWTEGEFASTKSDFGDDDSENDERHIVINQKLSEVSRYVHSQNLETVTINSTMGTTSVYLDSAKPAGDTVIINVNALMSEIAIYLPLSWQLKDNLATILGEVEINGTAKGNGPTVILKGSSRFVSISINYV
ncbi:LiaF transmembrane domain-containing protein [Lactobacillus bombicola]|uniref:LiaF transmembrane domain-containing protein n=1 Tax=Lactobacillus bombicola TaxID=1505723 RepID=UPI000E59316B|nr:hypothetical protein [Lactobacillus bombicola]RHW51706.1 hypothetical protein DS833_02645 [Lactobacillus bombicola]